LKLPTLHLLTWFDCRVVSTLSVCFHSCFSFKAFSVFKFGSPFSEVNNPPNRLILSSEIFPAGGENSPAAFYGFASDNSTSELYSVYFPHYSNNQAVEALLLGLVR
jgi:hypothetical protein